MKRFLAITAAALLASVALAQGETPPAPENAPTQTAPAQTTPAPDTSAPTSVFDALDADRDGSIAQQEAQAHPTVAEHFAKADANSDGSLTREEVSATFKSQ